MSNLYTQQGVDFDTWFSTGNGSQWFGIYGDTGMDIGQVYLAGSGGPVSGFQISNGSDLNQHLGGYGYGIYRVGGVPWNPYVGSFDHNTQVNWWKNWLKTFYSKRTPCKYIAGIMDDCYYRNVNSDVGHSICVFGYSPLGGPALNFSYQERNREYGCSNRSHYMYSYYVEINPYLKGVVIVSGVGAGDDPCSEFYVTVSQSGQPTLVYDGIYGLVNDDNNPTYGSSGWNRNKWGRNWYWHA